MRWKGGRVVGCGGRDQFSDERLYTTYHCSRNSERLPWRLTTTHRSRQGNRKNIINKGTNNPGNKRKPDVIPSPSMSNKKKILKKTLIAAALQLRRE